MHHFRYEADRLHCEGVALDQITAQTGSPVYIYSASTFRDHFRKLDHAMHPVDHLICYAVKANSNLAVLGLLAAEGSGFDIVSGGELFRVLQAGCDPGRVTFAGVGKTTEEIEYALRSGIYSFNVESEAELQHIDEVAGRLGLCAPIAVRVNPNVDADTHKYISTGKSENKFGIGLHIAREVYARAAARPNLKMRGLQMHIGSQITKPGPFAEAVKKVAPLAAELRDAYGIKFFSIGGGMGIVYDSSLASGSKQWWTERAEALPMQVADYAAAVLPTLEPLGLRILLEPGRFIAGNAGILVTAVQYLKRTPAKTFAIVDAGMNDLIRPALYESFHEIITVRRPDADAVERVDVVGPVCESGDFFAQDRDLPALRRGDLLALMSAGAYGFVMASNYNSRPLPAEVLVEGDAFRVVRERQTMQDLVKGEATYGKVSVSHA